MVELARAMALLPGVYRVELMTRQVADPKVGDGSSRACDLQSLLHLPVSYAHAQLGFLAYTCAAEPLCIHAQS